MGSSGKGLSDWIGASFDPFGSIFGDSLGFDVDPIGNMIGQSAANISGMITGERDWDDVKENFFGSNWIGDVANPWVGGKSRQMVMQDEYNTMMQKASYGQDVMQTGTDENLIKPFRSKAKTFEERDESRRKAVQKEPTSLLDETEDTGDLL